MTVEGVAVRYSFPLTGEIDAMRFRTRDRLYASHCSLMALLYMMQDSLLRNAHLSRFSFPS